MHGVKPEICVIIAAKDASDTIAASVTSALKEPEVAEVIVVDDASTDATGDIARYADDGSNRLKVLRLDENKGPAAARNIAIERSKAPYFCVLDADDVFVKGRFANLLRYQNWDLMADNILFLDKTMAWKLPALPSLFINDDSESLDFKRFVDGNISKRGKMRGELGFLKPLVSRAFADTFSLRYNEDLRLGEDYEFYARAIALGARFRITRACGYVAFVRSDSLSASHKTLDLKRLADADRHLLESQHFPPHDREVLERHEGHVRDKYRLRMFLDIKSEVGLVSALAFAGQSLDHALPVVRGVMADKADALRRLTRRFFTTDKTPSVRFLMPQIYAETADKGLRSFVTGALIATATAIGFAANSLPALASESFVDEFDRFQKSRWLISHGWNNGDHQNCTWSKNHVQLRDGVLVLRFEKQRFKDRNYACAEVQTKARFGYGIYEARMKTDGPASGLNAAFFTYIGPVHKKPHDEIDVEILTKDTSKAQLNYYTNAKGGNEKLITVPAGTDDGFNDYAFVWEEDRLRWYLNGELVHTISRSKGLPRHNQKIFFSFWGTDTLTEWMGRFEDPGRKLSFEIDRVAFTAFGDQCQFEGSVACGLN